MDAPMSKRILCLTFFLLLALVMPIATTVSAQDSGGQFWVQAFEDRNGDGAHNAGEPFLTRGVSVDLLNVDGVVMASATLDNAPYAAQGFIGFLYLAPGNYTAVISSPDLTPTTPARVDISITEDQSLVRVSFGAQREAFVETGTGGARSTIFNGEIARLALAGFGAIVVVGIMGIIGLLVYTFVLRKHAPVEVKRKTGAMRPVRVDETGEISPTIPLRNSDDQWKPR
jgi:hypothetical protein